MEKKEIISFIQQKLTEGVITKDDLATLQGPTPKNAVTPALSSTHESSRNLINVFYSIGAIIVIVGISILVGQNWSGIGVAGRLGVSVGISMLTYIAAYLLIKPDYRVLSQVFFTISAALAPLAAYVVYHELSIPFTASTQWPTALGLSLVFGAALYYSRRSVLYVLTAAFLIWSYYAFLFAEFQSFSFADFSIYKWATLILGFALVIIGYGIRARMVEINPSIHKETLSVRGIFYAFGTIALLSAGFSFSGTVAELLFLILLFGVFYASVFLKSRWMLVLAALYLMALITRLTVEYFANSIGWPVALIITGFLIIGVGYMTFYLNKRFISSVKKEQTTLSP